MREVLARAEEIQLHSELEDPESAQIEAIVAAAEEAGLSRDAVLQALRERLNVGAAPPALGERVFAESTDGKLYVAEVLEVGEGAVRVRFAKGGERTVPLSATHPCAFLPGQRVVCPWPNWGWWTCTVVSYDAEKGVLQASDGWSTTATFAIADVRLDPPRQKRAQSPMPRLRFFLYSLATGVALGSGLGALFTWLLMR